LNRTAVYDTSGAAKEIREGHLKGIAAIASTQAAADFGLDILAPDIQDRGDNYTRFLSVRSGLDPASAPAMAKTSVAFCIANVEGSLFRTLAAFGSRRNVNLIRIESRPLIGTSTSWSRYVRQHPVDRDDGIWDLVYYVDFVAPADKTRSILDHLRELVLERDGIPALQVLGTYAEGGLRDLTGTPWRTK
jgi:prephenate dehydratase